MISRRTPSVQAIVLATPAALHHVGAAAALRHPEGCELLEFADSVDRVLRVGASSPTAGSVGRSSHGA